MFNGVMKCSLQLGEVSILETFFRHRYLGVKKQQAIQLLKKMLYAAAAV